jgi:hypothetical protein
MVYLQLKLKQKRYMAAAVLNPSQLHLLRMFSHNQDEESFKVLKEALFNYYCQKMDEESDKWWEENNMTTEKFEEMFSNTHYRTPYK